MDEVCLKEMNKHSDRTCFRFEHWPQWKRDSYGKAPPRNKTVQKLIDTYGQPVFDGSGALLGYLQSGDLKGHIFTSIKKALFEQSLDLSKIGEWK